MYHCVPYQWYCSCVGGCTIQFHWNSWSYWCSHGPSGCCRVVPSVVAYIQVIMSRHCFQAVCPGKGWLGHSSELWLGLSW